MQRKSNAENTTKRRFLERTRTILEKKLKIWEIWEIQEIQETTRCTRRQGLQKDKRAHRKQRKGPIADTYYHRDQENCEVGHSQRIIDSNKANQLAGLQNLGRKNHN